MKKLIVSGDSFSSDYVRMQLKNPANVCYDPDIDIEPFPIWPEILAEKLGMELINVAVPASGNEYILSSIMDVLIETDPGDNGLVLAMWSEYVRIDIESTSGWIRVRPRRQFRADKPVSKWHDKAIQAMKDLPYNQLSNIMRGMGIGMKDASFQKSMRMMFCFQSVCESMGVPYLQMQALPPVAKPEWILESPYYNKLKNFLGYPIIESIGGHDLSTFFKDEHIISKRDYHPNAKGHKYIAELMEGWINEKR